MGRFLTDSDILSKFLLLFFAQIASYLFGSIPFGYLIGKACAGIDVREFGSGNIGATNVGRILGFRFFLLVFLLDFLKGALPVLVAIALQTSLNAHSPENPNKTLYLPELAGLAAIIGHMFPIYLGLKGGKGVATSIGVISLLTPIPAACALGVWLVLAALTRIISLSSIIAAIGYTLAHFLTVAEPFGPLNCATSLFVLVASILVVVRHRENIDRLLKGTEPRFTIPARRKAASAEEKQAET